MQSIFIAELGINHHGDMSKAIAMCAQAAEAGATYIKGQYYNPIRVLGKDHPELQYAIQCQFTRQQHEMLALYCEKLHVPYFVSVFNVGDIGWANSFSPVHKVASRMNDRPDFISVLERTKKPIFASVQPTTQKMPDRFKLMWCVRNYPSTKEEVMQYPYSNIGLSSHCPDWTASYEAFKAGARVFENHVCESRQEKGCDIASSLEFSEYKEFIKKVTDETGLAENSALQKVRKTLTPGSTR